MKIDKFDRKIAQTTGRFLDRLHKLGATADNIPSVAGMLLLECGVSEENVRQVLHDASRNPEARNFAFNDRVRELAQLMVHDVLAESGGNEDIAVERLAENLRLNLRDAYDHVCCGIAADVVWCAQQDAA